MIRVVPADSLTRHSAVLGRDHPQKQALVLIGQLGGGPAARLDELGRLAEPGGRFGHFEIALQQALSGPPVSAPPKLVVGEVAEQPWVFGVRGAPVSYTHLTLPTILR